MSNTASKSAPSVPLVAPPENPTPRVHRYLSGSDHEKFSTELLNGVINTLWLAHKNPDEKRSVMDACLEAMVGIGPKDETEGMLAAQMVACHHAAMECLRRAMISDQSFESRKLNLNFGNKLSRTYALHMETLDKHRGKGQQKVTVEHVHVHQGGQAIVGSVSHAPPGGGITKSEEQPHAKPIAHAPESEMPSEVETEPQAMPERRDG